MREVGDDMREARHDVDIRTQSGMTICCQVRSGEDDKGEGGAEKGGGRDANLGWG